VIVNLPDASTNDINKKIISLREEGGAVTMGRVLTLVIAPDSEEVLEDSVEAANFASREHPCRVIAVLPGDRKATDPRLDAEIRVAREVFRQRGVLTVGVAAGQQVAAAHRGRDDSQACPARRSRRTAGPATTAATTTEASTAAATRFPGRHRIALQRSLGWRRLVGIEVKEAGLRTRVQVDLQGVVIRPGDVQSSRHAKAAAGRVGPAALAFRWGTHRATTATGTPTTPAAATAASRAAPAWHTRSRRIR